MMFVRSAIIDGSGSDVFVEENWIDVSVGQSLRTPRYPCVREVLHGKQFYFLGCGDVMRIPFSLVFSSLICFLFLAF